MNEEAKKENIDRELGWAIVVVLLEFIVWFLIAVYFFRSPYSRVSSLFPFVLGFPLASLLLHGLFYLFTSVFDYPDIRKTARYSAKLSLLLTILIYIGLYMHMSAGPFK